MEYVKEDKMKDFRNIFLMGVVAILTSSCAIWPYKKDFDCPIKEGLKCKSLYEISEMADQGMFGPNAIKNMRQDCECDKPKSRKFRIKRTVNKGCCDAS